MKKNKAVAILLQSHGLMTIGKTPAAAAAVAAEVEQELGILMDCIRASGGRPDSYNFFPGKVVSWHWKYITKGNPWEKVYSKK